MEKNTKKIEGQNPEQTTKNTKQTTKKIKGQNTGQTTKNTKQNTGQTTKINKGQNTGQMNLKDLLPDINLQTTTINKIKFPYIHQQSEINEKFKDDMVELLVFSNKDISYSDKRKVFVNLLVEFTLTVKRFMELLLNRTADISLKIETFHKFLWQLKKIVLIINSHNPMKVKNNAF